MKKYELHDQLIQWNVRWTEMIDFLQLNRNELTRWLSDCNTVTHLREVKRYINNTLTPFFQEVKAQLLDIRGIKLLESVNPGDPRLKAVKEYRKQMLAFWRSRPKEKSWNPN